MVTALPEVDDGHVDCSSFPRLAKLAVRSGKVPEEKVRSLAGRFRVELPPSTDLTEAAKAKWVWGLAQLSQCITVRATGWLKLSTTQEEFDANVLELSDDGRFTPEWMTERRRQRAESAQRERARRELGTGFDPTLTPMDAWAHVSSGVLATGADADRSLASDAARSLRRFHDLELEGGGLNVMKMAAGTAVLTAMRRKGHGVDRLGVAPSGTAEALQYIVTYVVPTPTPTFDGGEPATGAAAAAAPSGAPTVRLSADSMAALQAAAGRTAADTTAREPKEKITLGKAPQVAHERRPEWFSPKDVAPFERHEEAIKNLSLLDGEEFVAAWAALDSEARRLASVPIYAQDLARCPRLLALDVVYSKLTEEADNILIKGTSLEGDRESEEQRNEDRQRSLDLAKLRKGNVIEAGPQICIVNVRLASFWVFAMVPYQSGPTASKVNGVWDEAWRTWALVAEFSLGEECEIVPAVEMILKVVRKTSVSGHHQWPDQARCDYPGVAMWFFARDYRAYREGRVLDKPSLLQIFQSTDYLTYFKMHIEYAINMDLRPKRMPYQALVIGSVMPKRARAAFDVADLADDGAVADDEATPTKARKRKPKGKGPAQQAPPKAPPKAPKAPKSEPAPAPHAGAGAARQRLGFGLPTGGRLGLSRPQVRGTERHRRVVDRDHSSEVGSVERHRQGRLCLLPFLQERLPEGQARRSDGGVRSRAHGTDRPQAGVLHCGRQDGGPGRAAVPQQQEILDEFSVWPLARRGEAEGQGRRCQRRARRCRRRPKTTTTTSSDRLRRRRWGSGASRERHSLTARSRRSGAGDRRATALDGSSVRPPGRVARR